MDRPTKKVSNFVNEKKVSIKNMAEKTGLSYQCLYDSLGRTRRGRDLKAGEYFKVCDFLGIDPLTYKEIPITESET